jgi:hypothetical protein
MADKERERITVWVTISSHRLLGPVFFEETVNNECYLSTLCNTFVPHLLATGFPLQTQWFMQDGARLHTVKVLDVLHNTFDSHFITDQLPNCPPNGPDLNPCDYFLWGFLKD